MESFDGKRISILSPVIRSRKGHYRDLFEQIAKQGFVKVRTDGVIVDITKGMMLDRYKMHDIEIVIDRLKIDATYTIYKPTERKYQYSHVPWRKCSNDY